MLKCRIVADRRFVLSKLDRRVFGTFVEMMGRCVYGGIYEPGHPSADRNGFRQDVLELTRELGPTIVRFPGGNFLSGYDWRDGIGPKDQRPVRLCMAWGSTEPNQFGTNEFIDWCRAADIEPMFAVNLGTHGPDEARYLLEYCNHPGGTYYSDLRRAHGYERPHDIRFWCLGNEMDGPWQICRKTATEYGRIAQETAKVMRWVDGNLLLAACGSSQRAMPTYGSWEYEVLDHCFNEVDFISLHAYFGDHSNDIAEYFTAIEDLSFFIREVAAICDAVAAKRRSHKRIMLSLDEWNVWYRARTPIDLRKPGWPVAPQVLEEIYNFEDALIAGGALITMINNADRVKTACLAQLVNVLGAIRTQTGGPAWRQTIFHPFAQAARHARGEVLLTKIQTEAYSTKTHPYVPFVLATVVYDEQAGTATILALNRSATDEAAVEVELCGLGADLRLSYASELHHSNLKAINSKDAPDEVAPLRRDDVTIKGGVVRTALKPLSWNVIVTAAGRA